MIPDSWDPTLNLHCPTIANPSFFLLYKLPTQLRAKETKKERQAANSTYFQMRNLKKFIYEGPSYPQIQDDFSHKLHYCWCHRRLLPSLHLGVFLQKCAFNPRNKHASWTLRRHRLPETFPFWGSCNLPSSFLLQMPWPQDSNGRQSLSQL